MKTFRKSIAIVLAALMLLAVMPFAALAATTSTGSTIGYYISSSSYITTDDLNEAVSQNYDGYIYILTSIEISETIEITQDTYICTSGLASTESITRASGFTDVMFSIAGTSEEAITVTFTNIEFDGGSDGETETAQVLEIYYASVSFAKCSISNNYAESFLGGAIYAGTDAYVYIDEDTTISNITSAYGAIYLASNSEVVCYGTISGCVATGDGGAVYISNANASFTLQNSSIKNCSADGSGGGIYIAAGEVYLTDATISGCYSDENGGGVYGASGTLYLFGEVVISGNTNAAGDSNLLVADTDKFTIDILGDLSSSSYVGISYVDNITEGTTISWIVVEDETEEIDIITLCLYDEIGDGYYFSVENDYTILYLECYIVTFDAGKGECDTDYVVVVADNPLSNALDELPEATRDGYTFLGWYTESTAGEGDEITLDTYIVKSITIYAQWENDNAIDTSFTSVIGSFFEKLGDILMIVINFLKNLFSGNYSGTTDYLTNDLF